MTWVIGDIRPMPRTTCPDCRDGKHGCVGEAWDRELDEPAICDCWERNHEVQL